MSIETETRKIIARLERKGWINVGGAKHMKFEHNERPNMLIVVPRHKKQSIGVARSIAKAAEWL